MFTQILVPVDGGELAEAVLPDTVSVARAFNAGVTLLQVLRPPTETSRAHRVDPLDWSIRQIEAENFLKGLIKRFHIAGVPASSQILSRQFSENDFQGGGEAAGKLVILPLGPRQGEAGWSESSSILEMAARACASVMIVRSEGPAAPGWPERRYRRILVPLDGSQRAEYGLSAAVRLARFYGAELLIAHVIRPPEMPRRTALSSQDRALTRQVVESNRAAVAEYLRELESRLDVHVKTCVLVGGNVAAQLHALVEQEGIDLTVLNAHGLTGEARWPYGNVAANFMAYSPVPALVVQDFARESPGYYQSTTRPSEWDPSWRTTV